MHTDTGSVQFTERFFHSCQFAPATQSAFLDICSRMLQYETTANGIGGVLQWPASGGGAALRHAIAAYVVMDSVTSTSMACHGTLVFTKPTLVAKWQADMCHWCSTSTAHPDDFAPLVVHGPGAASQFQRFLQAIDGSMLPVVITTPATWGKLIATHRQLVQDVMWLRTIHDIGQRTYRCTPCGHTLFEWWCMPSHAPVPYRVMQHIVATCYGAGHMPILSFDLPPLPNANRSMYPNTTAYRAAVVEYRNAVSQQKHIFNAILYHMLVQNDRLQQDERLPPIVEIVEHVLSDDNELLLECALLVLQLKIVQGGHLSHLVQRSWQTLLQQLLYHAPSASCVAIEQLGIYSTQHARRLWHVILQRFPVLTSNNTFCDQARHVIRGFIDNNGGDASSSCVVCTNEDTAAIVLAECGHFTCHICAPRCTQPGLPGVYLCPICRSVNVPDALLVVYRPPALVQQCTARQRALLRIVRDATQNKVEGIAVLVITACTWLVPVLRRCLRGMGVLGRTIHTMRQPSGNKHRVYVATLADLHGLTLQWVTVIVVHDHIGAHDLIHDRMHEGLVSSATVHLLYNNTPIEKLVHEAPRHMQACATPLLEATRILANGSPA